MPPGVAVPAAFPGNPPPPPPCRSPPLVIHRGGGGVTWSTQNFLLRLIVLLSSYAESFRFMLQFLCLWPANVACTVVVRSPRGGGGGPSLGHHPQGGGRGPSSLGWGRTRGGRVSDSAYPHCVLCPLPHRLVGQSSHWIALILDSERFLECLLVSGLQHHGLNPPPTKVDSVWNVGP